MSDSSTQTRERIDAVRTEVAKVVVGQTGIVSGMVTALLIGGHVLLEGVPGTAKTLMVKALAQALALTNTRVQFTPDMMPSDILGQSVYDPSAPNLESSFRFRPGPVFTNMLLADEINRTPPRTQAALLESMEERRVTVEGEPLSLPDPFFVVATQNPIEQEGTYPLPEAQLDRFVFKLQVGYPSIEEECAVLDLHDRGLNPHQLDRDGIQAVASAEDILAARRQIAAIKTDQSVIRYIVDLANASRQAPSLSLGISPRGSTWLLKAAKAWAWLNHRDYVTPDDVKAMFIPTMRHRISLRPDVAMDGATPVDMLNTLMAGVAVPK